MANKTGFRETMWFKMGEATEEVTEESVVPLPIEDRYTGSVSAEDSRTFGVHTGTTECLETINLELSDDVSMKSLVREMKVNKQRIAFAIAASVAAVGSVLAFYVG
jgi:hypothetical protein